MKNSKPDETGTLLGLSLIGLLAILGVLPFVYGFELGPIKEGKFAIFLGLYVQTWGLMFLLSYYFSHKTFFLRGLMWMCENFSSPKGRFMAFFYFLLAFSLGSMALIKGLGI